MGAFGGRRGGAAAEHRERVDAGKVGWERSEEGPHGLTHGRSVHGPQLVRATLRLQKRVPITLGEGGPSETAECKGLCHGGVRIALPFHL